MEKFILREKLYLSLLEAVTQELKSSPGDIELLRLRGLLYNLTAQYGKAIEDFQKVVDMDPESISEYFLKSDCHLNLGEDTLAKKDFLKALFLQEKEPLTITEDDEPISKEYLKQMNTVLLYEKNRAINNLLLKRLGDL